MTRAVLVLTITVTALASRSGAQSPTFSPSNGQTAAQQSKDTADCRAIAAQQSGFDPATAQAPAAPPPPPPGGQRVRGAARGAAIGATAGAIGGDAGKGAAAGAAAGTVAGGARKRQAARDQQAQVQQQQAAHSQGQVGYDKALAACMQGKGYAVTR